MAAILLRKLVPAYVLFALLITGLQVFVEYRNTRENLRNTLMSLANAAAPSAEAALWEYQEALLKPMAEGIGSHPEAVSVIIADQAGRLSATWESALDNHPSKELTVQRILERQDGATKRTLGTLTVASSERIAFNLLMRSVTAVVGVALLQFVFLGLMLWLLIRSQVVKPLADFAERVKTMKESTSTQTLMLNKSAIAEIDTLQQAFTRLIRRLRESHALIAEHNADLEKRVVERTLALESEEARFRSIFERTNTGIAFAGANGALVDFNTAFAAMLGCERAELLGVSIGKFTYAGDVAAEMALFNEIIDNKRNDYRIEKRYVTKNGQILWVDLAVTVIRNSQGAIQSFVGLVVDITERKRANEYLRANEQKLRALFELSPLGITRNSFDGRYIEANQALLDMVGYSLSELNQLSYWDLTPQSYADQEAEQLKSMEDTGRYGPYEKHYTHRDGRLIPVALNGIVVTDSNDEKYIWSLVEDITQRKNAEDELNRARKAAEGANQAKSEFLANMSHEIRTPMNAIMGLTQLVLDTDLDAEQSDYLRKAYGASKALLSILNDILDYSKIEAGRLDIGSWPMGVEQVLSDVANLFSAGISEKRLELFIEIGPDVPAVVMGDGLRLTQVLNNLVNNALKFTERGSVVLSVRPIEISSDHGAGLTFAVRDTGIGLDEAQIGRLFSAFTQADTSSTRRYGGTGLGLVISQRLVALMGADISVSSTLGQGSVFSFTVDLGAIDPDQEKAEKAGQAVLFGKKVRVIEGQAEVARILCEALLRLGAELVDIETCDLLVLGSGSAAQAALGYENGTRPVVAVLAPSQSTVLLPSFVSVLSRPATRSSLRRLLCRLLEVPDRQGLMADQAPILAPDFSGYRVLLVDDNELNQLVGNDLLEKTGVTVGIASHGLEAVEATRKQPWDVVLMDMQMPVMDGIDATLAIRQQTQNRALPIVAMTAHALDEERQRCMSAGMNDFITKPVSPADLYRVMGKYLIAGAAPRGEVAATLSGNSVVLSPAPAGEFRFDPVAAMSLLPSQERAHKMLGIFVNNHRETPEKFRQWGADNAFESASALAHTLKGSAHYAGAGSLAALAAQLELAARNNSDGWPALSSQLADAVASICGQIEAYLNQAEVR